MKTLLILSTLIFSLHSFAGKEGGNGGFAYVCENKVMLVDLEEIKHLSSIKGKITVSDDRRSFEVILKEKLELLASLYPEEAGKIKSSIDWMLNHSLYKPVDQVIKNDLGDYPRLPNCPVKSVVQFFDNDAVYIDQQKYDAMTSQHKAALWIHEALYSKARQVSAIAHSKGLVDGLISDSKPIRRLVAILFSENFSSHQKVFKEIFDYYVNPHKLKEKMDLEFCIESIYAELGPGRKTSYISTKDFVEETAFRIRQFPTKHMGYSRKHKVIRIKEDDYITQNTRCDGSYGESYLFKTTVEVDNENGFIIRYKTMVDFVRQPKEANARMTISFFAPDRTLRASFIEEDHVYGRRENGHGWQPLRGTRWSFDDDRKDIIISSGGPQIDLSQEALEWLK